MPKTRARGSVEDWLDSLDPATTPAVDAADLRHIGEAMQDAEDADQKLADAIRTARAHGHSWTSIGVVLGVSKQAAQQRFGGARSVHRGASGRR
jgi:hypothetical protein